MALTDVRFSLARRLARKSTCAIALALIGAGVVLGAFFDWRWLAAGFGLTLALALPAYGAALWAFDRWLPRE